MSLYTEERCVKRSHINTLTDPRAQGSLQKDWTTGAFNLAPGFGQKISLSSIVKLPSIQPPIRRYLYEQLAPFGKQCFW